MNINDKLYGFTVKEKRSVAELSADVYTLEHDKVGTRLTYIAREDDNMTFAVTFKTLPEDSTGVFHILEHSVLCGSDKYPVKDPFVELLKGSLNTFLNAMTFQDKTMYPVSSRCGRDFLNLVGIYMDAVLHPLAVKSPLAFYQEGWHYEIDEGGALSYKGVVLNEMRGDYSTPEAVSDRHINDLLYEGTPYAHDSGGDPEQIVTLSYEQFVAAHKKYYHPSYAELFLDGSVSLFEVLPLLDSYLSTYERASAPKEALEIPRVTISAPKERTVRYEVKDGEDVKDKTRVTIGYIIGAFDECERLVGTNILQRVLLSTNESPVKREIIASGLCEDVLVSMRDGILEPALLIDFINVKDGKVDELLSLFDEQLRRAVAEGLDKEELAANLNYMEFQVRERDYGTLPTGVVHAMVSLESLLYSSDPVQNFECERSFSLLRAAIDGDYFERLLSEVMADNPRRATVIMLPDAALAAERAEREARALGAHAASLDEAGREEIADMNARLAEWQSGEDSPAALAAIPTLSLSDISDTPRLIPTECAEVGGVRALLHKIPTGGIIYAELYFDVSDIGEEELPLLALYNSLLTNLPTEKHSATEIQRLVKASLGGFDLRMVALCNLAGETPVPKAYLVVSASALATSREKIPEITEEILGGTRFDNYTAIKNILRQTVISSEESFSASGHRIALGRVAAATSVEGALREYYSGYEAYIRFKRLDENFDAEKESLCEALRALGEKYLTRERLTLSLTGECDEGYLESLAKIVETGDKVAPVCKIKPFPARREGIAIPAQVAFAAKGASLFSVGERPSGAYDVVRTLASYEHLWPEVRVKGGAYGAGMSVGINGSLGFYSYRDPTPARALGAFDAVPAFLRSFAASGADVTKYIIGAVGDAEPVRTPRMCGASATSSFLRGITYEDECAIRRSMLSVDSARLSEIADTVERALEGAAVCVVAPRDKLSSLEGLDAILEI